MDHLIAQINNVARPAGPPVHAGVDLIKIVVVLVPLMVCVAYLTCGSAS
jgi:hypothetical protein